MGRIIFDRIKNRFIFSFLHPSTLRFFLKAQIINLLNRVIRFFYNSNRAKCNICNWEGNRFDVLWQEKYVRYNEKCPRCGSISRHRYLIEYIRNQHLGESKSFVLDIAPIKSFKSFFNRLGSKYISVDLESYLADIKMDIIRLGFRDNVFDLLICYHVLEHVLDDVSGIKEIYRVTKIGGTALIQVPINICIDKTLEYGKADPLKAGHVREYGNDFKSKLNQVGFSVEIVKHGDLNLKYTMEPDIFFLCRK